jgi:hypothetical protein
LADKHDIFGHNNIHKLVTIAMFAPHTSSEWLGGEVWPQAQAYISTDLRQNWSCLYVGDGIFWLGKAHLV